MKKFVRAGLTLAGGVILSAGCLGISYAQEGSGDNGYNPHSVNPIHDSKKLYEIRVWRRMDLNEKQNKPFFASNRQITKHMIEAVKDGKLYPYQSDSLEERMSKEEFLKQLELPNQGGGGDDFGGGDDGGWGDDADDGGDDGGGGWGAEGEDDGGEEAEGGDDQQQGTYYFQPRDIEVLEIKEDVIFDKERSALYHKIQSVKMIIKPEHFPQTGLLREVATFRYKDLYELFKSEPEKYQWINPQNPAANRNLTQAFELRLFNARIVKYSNPDDERILEMNDGNQRAALIESKEKEYELMEKEHELWSY